MWDRSAGPPGTARRAGGEGREEGWNERTARCGRKLNTISEDEELERDLQAQHEGTGRVGAAAGELDGESRGTGTGEPRGRPRERDTAPPVAEK